VAAPPAFGALVGPLGWAGAFGAAAACPLVGWWVLAPLGPARRATGTPQP